MRIFSGDNKAVDSPTNTHVLKSPSTFGAEFGSRLKVNTTSKKKASNSSSPTSPMETSPVSPELVPIITLLNAHTHRRYHEGVFLILQDLKNNGTHAARKWKDVYGVLIGTQLALWDAKELAEFSDPSCPVSEKKLKEIASKPTYINLTDATLRTLDTSDNIVMECGKNLTNALVVSTTLKNRYFLQFGNKESFNKWNAAIRLCLYECSSLQEAYTGAFISSRGAKLGDIRILLTNRKYDYKDWVSVRFGAGMPWKRCYAVISQSNSRKKDHFGEINLYENDKKVKKNHAMATIVEAKALYAVYPSSPKLIDSSTIIKVVGSVKFEKNENAQEKDVFIMPEKHQAVPSYDTIIRFLIPAMDTFKLYGRPEKLLSSKNDPHSLLFGLPVLPHIYYLEMEDLLPLTNSISSAHWSNNDWREHVNDILQKKIAQGYCGCNSASNITSPLPSPFLGSADLFERADGVLSPKLSFGSKSSSNNSSKNSLPKRERIKLPYSADHEVDNTDNPTVQHESVPFEISGSPHKTVTPTDSSFRTKFTEGSPYSRQSPLKPLVPSINDSPSDKAKSRTDPYIDYNNMKMNTSERFDRGDALYDSNADSSLKKVRNIKLDIPASNFDKFKTDKNLLSVDSKSSNEKKLSVESDLSAIYEKYSNGPFGHTEGLNDSSDENYLRFQRASVHSENGYNPRISFTSGNFPDKDEEGHAVLQEFNSLTQRINELGIESLNSNSDSDKLNKSFSQMELDNDGNEDDMNLFDPDFMAQDQLRAEERDYNKDDIVPPETTSEVFEAAGLGIISDDHIGGQNTTEYRSPQEVPRLFPEKALNPLQMDNPYAKPSTKSKTTSTSIKTDRSAPQKGYQTVPDQQIAAYGQTASINGLNGRYGVKNQSAGSPRNAKTRAPPSPYYQDFNNRSASSNPYQHSQPSDAQPRARRPPGNPHPTGNRPNMQMRYPPQITAQYHPQNANFVPGSQQPPLATPPQQFNRPYQPHAMNAHSVSPGGYTGAPPFQPGNLNYINRSQPPWPSPSSPSTHHRPPPHINQPQGNGSAGFYRPPAPQLNNSRDRLQNKEGFSQFMPSATTKNPYAQ
ncbi:hypothetical protein SMKI_14G0580 [Saccharomyces mikatae IFO 1815]|uniref:PH domain-containing protein n=1 Tax=Saccharomyces mikatae IFO 1815 TaxID=226126 RepID=A0AA35NER8_SACMI|nr:uncharacterized protein SMKI_14G0580 [Saccharomyces mikatae IFO 1815]CAI4035849.1 hypothetical protein SMKI_14G0580 [Saccharomyces mikatae IFO 1815]